LNKNTPEVNSIQEHNNFVFLVDRSGSMWNTIALMKQALKIFIKNLEEGSYFNICSYGSEKPKTEPSRFVFPTSVIKDDKNVFDALNAIDKFEANWKLTDVKTPLEEVFKQIKEHPDAKLIKTHHVYMITDGKQYFVKDGKLITGNDAEILKLVGENCGLGKNVRFHSFGIGNGVDEKLIKSCAEKGLGHYYIAYKPEEIAHFANLSLAKNSVLMKELVVTKFELRSKNNKLIDFTEGDKFNGI
jgi:hypothetical protein